jgi:hypothetical protein
MAAAPGVVPFCGTRIYLRPVDIRAKSLYLKEITSFIAYLPTKGGHP